jgi:3-methyl-2-oxobutanoate hydroxymethyltransferase
MLKFSGCDCVKLEVAASHATLVSRLADAGVAVMAHLGLRPQWVGLLGGYRSQGKTAESANDIVAAAVQMQKAGAAALLLETVPAQVAAAVVAATEIPVVGCGAGPACHASVIVTHDALGLTTARPKFAPLLSQLDGPITAALAEYVRRVEAGEYPGQEHQYEMPPEEKAKFLGQQRR